MRRLETFFNKKESFFKVTLFFTRQIFFLWGLIFFCGCCFFEEAHAEGEKFGFQVDRTFFAVEAEVGRDYKLEFKLSNRSEFSGRFKVYVADYAIGEKNTVSFLDNGDPAIGIKDWFLIEDGEFILESGAEKKVDFFLRVPVGASPGSHRGAVFAEMLPVDKEIDNFSGSNLSGRVGMHILANVSGETNGAGKIESFQKKTFFWKENEFNAVFRNLGNVHYIPHGEIIIRNLITKKEERLLLEKHFVFPGQKYSFGAIWKNGNPWGAYWQTVYFVDGDKRVHTLKSLSFGYLFFPALTTCLLFVIYFFWRLKKRAVKRVE